MRLSRTGPAGLQYSYWAGKVKEGVDSLPLRVLSLGFLQNPIFESFDSMAKNL